jgi:hypothetical protein
MYAELLASGVGGGSAASAARGVVTPTATATAEATPANNAPLRDDDEEITTSLESARATATTARERQGRRVVR